MKSRVSKHEEQPNGSVSIEKTNCVMVEWKHSIL